MPTMAPVLTPLPAPSCSAEEDEADWPNMAEGVGDDVGAAVTTLSVGADVGGLHCTCWESCEKPGCEARHAG